MAEDLYRQILEAYGVLGNPDSRRDYDRVGQAGTTVNVAATLSFEGFDFSTPAEGASAATFSEMFTGVFQQAARRATGPEAGGAIEAELDVPFEDAMRGGALPLSVVRHERCSSCAGDGRQARPPVVCPDCRGEGQRRWARGHMVFAAPCEVCGGAGQVTWQRCRTCQGVGLQPRNEVVTVHVPPGLEHDSRVVVPGRGHAGLAGQPTGDLYVRIRVGDHPFFRRLGRDLRLTLPVAVHEAALGARIRVPTLGAPAQVRIPPGTSSGQTLRLAGLGVPAASMDEPAGDLLLEIEIVLPPLRDERSRELLREFGRLNDVDPRRHLF
jgi:molecular chaperone DnaJ